MQTDQEPKRILVFGDSYANFQRFDAGIKQACERRGIPVEVTSIAYSGHHTGRLLARWDATGIKADHILLICGVNDVVGRRGVKAFRQSLQQLTQAVSQVSPNISLLEIPAFDEYAPVAKFASKCKRALSALIFDRSGNRIRRYRKAQKDMGCHIARTSDFLPQYDPSLFKDRIHFTDEAFVALGHHVGGQVAAAVSP